MFQSMPVKLSKDTLVVLQNLSKVNGERPFHIYEGTMQRATNFSSSLVCEVIIKESFPVGFKIDLEKFVKAVKLRKKEVLFFDDHIEIRGEKSKLFMSYKRVGLPIDKSLYLIEQKEDLTCVFRGFLSKTVFLVLKMTDAKVIDFVSIKNKVFMQVEGLMSFWEYLGDTEKEFAIQVTVGVYFREIFLKEDYEIAFYHCAPGDELAMELYSIRKCVRYVIRATYWGTNLASMIMR